MQIAPLSATFSITTWRAIKCNADTESETFSRELSGPSLPVPNSYKLLNMRYRRRAFLYKSRLIRAPSRADYEHRRTSRRVKLAPNIEWKNRTRDTYPILTHFIAKRFTTRSFDGFLIAVVRTGVTPCAKWFHRAKKHFTRAFFIVHREFHVDNFSRATRESRPRSLCPAAVFSFPPTSSHTRNVSSLLSFSLSESGPTFISRDITGGLPRFSQSNFHRRLIFVYTLWFACNPTRGSLRRKGEWRARASFFNIFRARAITPTLTTRPYVSRMLFLLSLPSKSHSSSLLFSHRDFFIDSPRMIYSREQRTHGRNFKYINVSS